MVRLLLHLFGIRNYESCKSCETLKLQLDYANAEKKELMETLLQITRPAVTIPQESPKILNPLQQAAGSFARRRGLLEQAERVKADIIKSSPFIAQPDNLPKTSVNVTSQSIEKLESELGLTEDKENAS